MSRERQDSPRTQRDGELLLLSNRDPMGPPGQMGQSALPEPMSKLLEVLERRSQERQNHPRRRKNVKQRLVSQWKQTLALSSIATRKLVTDPPRTPKPAPRRAPPKPPNPLRSPGRTEVSRIRREDTTKRTAIEPVLAAEPVAAAEPAVVAEPVVVVTPKPHAPKPHTPKPHTPKPSRWIPTLPSLSTRIAEAAVQTAGSLLLALAVKTGSALATLATPPPTPPRSQGAASPLT